MIVNQLRALEMQRDAANTERLLLVGRIHRLNEDIKALQEEDRLARGVPPISTAARAPSA